MSKETGSSRSGTLSNQNWKRDRVARRRRRFAADMGVAPQMENLEERMLLTAVAEADAVTVPQNVPFVSATGVSLIEGSDSSNPTIWKFLDDGTSQDGQETFDPLDATWFASPSYDDSFWPAENVGPAILGFGDAQIDTQIDDINQITNYFRTTFELADQAAVDSLERLLFTFRRDDSIAVYINGVDVLRDELAVGALFNTPSQSTAAGADELLLRNAEYDLTSSPNPLVVGTNHVAVEIHQANATSSDVIFDLSISGDDGGFAPILQNDDWQDKDTTGGDVTVQLVDPTTFLPVGDGPVPVFDALTFTTEVGQVELLSNIQTGAYRFTPNQGFAGDAIFLYELTDNFDASIAGPTTVTITVEEVNDPPAAANDWYTGQQGQTISANIQTFGDATDVLVAQGSSWFYSDDGSDQDTDNPGWNLPGFDPNTATGWNDLGTRPASPAQLGFGENDEATELSDTDQLTFYFQQTFDAPGTPSNVDLLLKRDDSAVVYINGVEVLRNNIAEDDPLAVPPVELNYLSTALGTLPDDGEEWARFNLDVTGLLAATGNTIAVEVHQANTTSSDVSFDLQLTSSLQYPGVMHNDSDEDVTDTIDTLTANLIDSSALDAVGTFTLNPDGTFEFIPDAPSPAGVFTFTYQLEDDEGATSGVATATITIEALDNGPVVAVDDSFTMDEDQEGGLVVDALSHPAGDPLVNPGVGLLANDTTATADVGDPVTITITNTLNLNGTLLLDGNTGGFTYTPDADFNGQASFTYTVNDGFSDSNEATVTIDVNPVADPPVAVNDTYTVEEDGVLVVDVAVTPPSNTLIETGSEWTYYDGLQNDVDNGGANPDDYPVDSNTVPWNLPGFDTALSGVTWETGNGLFAGPLNGVGFPGTTLLDGIDAATNGTDNTITTYLFLKEFNVADATGVDSLLISALVDDGAAFYLNGVELENNRINLAPGVLTTTTLATGNGNEGAFVDQVVDLAALPGGNPLVTGTNFLAVEVHQVQTTSSDVAFDMSLEIPPPIVGILGNDFDPEGDAIISLDQEADGQTKNGTLTLNPDGTFTYTPDANFAGEDTFFYTISTADGTSNRAEVTINVTATDDPAVGQDDAYSVNQDTTLSVILPEFSADVGNANALLPAGSSWTYNDTNEDQSVANPGWNSLGFDPSTAAGWTTPAAPGSLGYGDAFTTLIAEDDINGDDVFTAYFHTTFNVADASGISDVLVHLLRDDGAAVYLNGVEIVRDNLIPGALHGQEAGRLIGKDGEGAFYTHKVDVSGILVTGMNEIAVEVHQTTQESSDLGFDLAITLDDGLYGVLNNDTDPDLTDDANAENNPALTATLISPPAFHDDQGGTTPFVLNADGTFEYTPLAGVFGVQDSFTYDLDDGTGNVTNHTVTIDVLEVGGGSGVDVVLVPRIASSGLDEAAAPPSSDLGTIPGTGGTPFAQLESNDMIIEVWAKSADGSAISGFELDLGTNTNFAVPTGHIVSGIFSENASASGPLSNQTLAGETLSADKGDDEWVLLTALIYSTDAPIDPANGIVGPFDAGVVASAVPGSFDLVGGGTADAVIAAEPTVGIHPVIQDYDNNGVVNFADMGFVLGAIANPAAPQASWADFDGDEDVDNDDIDILAQAVGISFDDPSLFTPSLAP